MFFDFLKKKAQPTQSQIDYARELYRMFHNRELRAREITKENIERIIFEYSNKLTNRMGEQAEAEF